MVLQTEILDNIGSSGIKQDGTPYRVLIVDDSKFVKKQLGKILESEGYEIISTAAHGAEAVDKYKELKEDIDLVTMDITMPGMDGVTAMEKIVQFDNSAKVVMVSALGKHDLVKKSFMLGASNYIVKPLNRDKVVERLSYVLNN
ncbi:MAG: response regulator [Spirochaetes bacterium]|nr:MAG: response regulator [Spirochaetota bacterium]